MKVVFILRKIVVSPQMGIMCLSASLKKAGHQTDLICYEKENFIEKLSELKPDIVAYSLTTGAHRDLIAINKIIKKHFQVYSVFGGPHVTFFPDIIHEEGIDAICIGEGDDAFVEFVNKLSKGESVDNVKNFWIKKGTKIIKNPPRKLIENLDRLPYADRELIYEKLPFFKKLKIKRLMASRGCPFRCTYCFNIKFNALYKGKGKIIRQRSADHVINEILEIRKKYPLKTVKFIDDTFNINPAWLKEFCEKYEDKVGLPFICNVRADLITPEIVRQLKSANCILVCMGIETGNEKIRKEMLKRDMSNEQIINACRLLKKARIKIFATNMLGLPGEDLDKTFETILFNAKCRVDFPEFSLFQPYPSTQLTEYAVKKGLYEGNYENIDSDYLHKSPLKLGHKEKRKLENLQEFGFLLVRFPFLSPLVKTLITFPENPFYKLFYSLSYGASLWFVFSIALGSDVDFLESITRIFDYI